MFKFSVKNTTKKEIVIRTLEIEFSEEILVEIKKLLMEGYKLTDHKIDLSKKNPIEWIGRMNKTHLKLEFTGDRQYTYKHQRLD